MIFGAEGNLGAVQVVLLLDILVPVAIAVVLAVLNARGHKSGLSEILFWAIAAAYVALLAVLMCSAATSVNETHGYGIVGTVVLAFPASVLAAIAHVALAYGLGVGLAPEMTSIFAVSLVCWAVLNPLVARRIRQRVRTRKPIGITEYPSRPPG